MFERIQSVCTIGAILCVPILLLMGCGGDASKGVRTMQDGKVIVRNETSFKIQATVYEVAGGNPVETLVEGNETKEISGVIPGGAEVEVILEPVVHVRWPSKIKVTVDGNMTIRVLKVAYEGPIQYEITGG